MSFQGTAHLLLIRWVTKQKKFIIFILKYLTFSSTYSLRIMWYLCQPHTSRQSFSLLDHSENMLVCLGIFTEWYHRLHSLLYCNRTHTRNEVTEEPSALYRWIKVFTLNSTDILILLCFTFLTLCNFAKNACHPCIPNKITSVNCNKQQ